MIHICVIKGEKLKTDLAGFTSLRWFSSQFYNASRATAMPNYTVLLLFKTHTFTENT